MTRTPLAAALAALALTLTAGTALAATGHATRDVNVRAGAGTSYAVIGSLEAGDEVEILGCGGGWCATDEGYVAAAYLAIAADGGITTKTMMKTTRTTTVPSTRTASSTRTRSASRTTCPSRSSPASTTRQPTPVASPPARQADPGRQAGDDARRHRPPCHSRAGGMTPGRYRQPRRDSSSAPRHRRAGPAAISRGVVAPAPFTRPRRPASLGANQQRSPQMMLRLAAALSPSPP